VLARDDGVLFLLTALQPSPTRISTRMTLL
jgi:hypothetical protein